MLTLLFFLFISVALNTEQNGTLALTIMTERGRALHGMGAILEKESQQVLLTELHDAEHLLGSESKGFLYQLINGGLDKVRSFVQATNPEVPKNNDEENQDDAGAASTTNNKDTKLLDAKEFLEYVIGKADKLSKDEQWSDSFTLILFDKSSSSTSCEHYLSGYNRDKDGMIKAAWEALREVSELKEVRVTWKEKRKTFQPEFDSYSVDVWFEDVTGDRVKLKAFLEEKLLPLKGLGEGGIMEANVGFVDTKPFQRGFNIESIQADKMYAIVVVGESGSGKSVYACQKAKDEGFMPVYCLPGGATDSETNRRKPALEHVALNDFLRHLIICFEEEHPNGSVALSRLYSIKSKLNKTRNAWAVQVVTDALKNAVADDANAQSWLAGKWSKQTRPEKVAIIVDEATDIDLLEGLVATVRYTSARYRELLAQKSLLIVLAGTGLDLIRFPNRAGTNPDYASLITLTTPNVDKILAEVKDNRDEIHQALTQGTFARVLRTNSRMLFRSVLPILQLPFHRVDGFEEVELGGIKRRRLGVRLTAIGSFKDMMDHAPRFYVNQNSIGRLTARMRSNLLQQAFVYHLNLSVDSLGQCNIEAVDKNKLSELKLIKTMQQDLRRRFQAMEGNKDNAAAEYAEPIFSRGLISRSGTSNALKYLACFGMTCELRPGYGNEFEELTALHFMRYIQVQGYETKRVTLKYAWPGRGEESITALENKLEEQAKDEEVGITGAEGRNGKKWCIVFSQGTPTAQGGDILALTVNDTDARLVSIQCKHFAKSPGEKALRQWWSSLGVKFTETEEVWEPKDCSAEYSFQGLKAFKDLLTRKLGPREVTFGDRILAVSFPSPSEATREFPIPSEDKARVWFREMFEPTISVLSLRRPAEVGVEEEEEE